MAETTVEAVKPAPGEVPPNAMSSWMNSLPSMAEQAVAPERPEPTGRVAPPPPVKPVDKPAETTTEKKVEPVKVEEHDDDQWPRSAQDWKARKAKQAERFKAVEKERDAIKTERDSVKAEIETLKKQGPSPELDGLKKERDALSERLRLVDVEKHPKFQSYFENKTNAQIELAKTIVGTDNAEAMAKALKMQDGPQKEYEIEKLTAGLTAVKQGKIGSVLATLDQIQQERNQAISDAKANYDEMTKSEKARADKQQADNAAFVSKTFADTIAKATDAKEGLFVFQRKADDTVWNDEVDKRIEVAKQLFSGQNKPESLAQAALYASALPAVLKAYQSEKETASKEIESLKAQVAKLTAANPGVQTGEHKANGEAPSRTPIKKGASPMEATSSWVKDMVNFGNTQTGQ